MFFKIPVFGAQLPLVVLWLVVGAIFFTVYLGFPQIRYFKHAWSVLRGRHSSADDPGDTTHFQALSSS